MIFSQSYGGSAYLHVEYISEPRHNDKVVQILGKAVHICFLQVQTPHGESFVHRSSSLIVLYMVISHIAAA